VGGLSRKTFNPACGSKLEMTKVRFQKEEHISCFPNPRPSPRSSFLHLCIVLARDKVGHAIRRVIEEKKRTSKSCEAMKGDKVGVPKQSQDDDSFGNVEGNGGALLSLDDFVETDGDVFDVSAGANETQGKVLDAAFKAAASSLIMPHKLDGVVVPSFLYQGTPTSNTPSNSNISTSTNLHEGGIQSLPHPSLSLDQQVLPRPEAYIRPTSQKQQNSNDAALFNMLSQVTSRQGLEGWMNSPLQPMQQFNAQSIMQQQQQDQFLPRITMTTSSFDYGGDLQQARLEALLDGQQRLNNQLLLQNRLSLAGEPGFSSPSASTNPSTTLGSMGLFSSSTSAMGSGGYGISTTTPNYGNFAAANVGTMGAMGSSTSFTLDSSLTSNPGIASLNDLAFLQSQQQMFQLQQERNNYNNNSNNNNERSDGNSNNNSNNFPFQYPYL
jgi:hypothetical protein